MDFSLTTAFVVPVGTDLATTGSTQDLTPGQLGVFLKDYTVAAATDVNKPIFLAQGRNAAEAPQSSKKSDFISKNKVIDFYKVTAVDTPQVQITNVSDFTASCGEQVSITLKAFSYYLNSSYSSGFTRSFTVNTPCCECGDDPCTVVDAEALVDQFVEKINDSEYAPYIVASKTGTGDATVLVLTGKPITKQGGTCDIFNFPFEFDAVDFFVYAYKGVATSQDFLVYEACDKFATVETTQNATYTIGSSDAVKLIETWYYSYQTSKGKDLFCGVNFNPFYTSNVVDGTFYDEYVIKFRTPEGLQTWGARDEQDETVRIFVEAGEGTALEAILTPILGDLGTYDAA